MADPDGMTTWDGKPVAPNSPHGATIVVYRLFKERVEFLILHRVYKGPDYAGDWAWTPPSGARNPGESIEACARRELAEETGLVLDLIPIKQVRGDWLVFAAPLDIEEEIQLSNEHDRYKWVPYAEALKLCQPAIVSDAFVQTALVLDLI